jgi:hypothetical protein
MTCRWGVSPEMARATSPSRRMPLRGVLQGSGARHRL